MRIQGKSLRLAFSAAKQQCLLNWTRICATHSTVGATIGSYRLAKTVFRAVPRCSADGILWSPYRDESTSVIPRIVSWKACMYEAEANASEVYSYSTEGAWEGVLANFPLCG